MGHAKKVTTRTPHDCEFCKKPITVGAQAFYLVWMSRRSWGFWNREYYHWVCWDPQRERSKLS